MAQIVIPDESLLRAPELWVPGRKPVGPVRVDWGHPLARGLYDAWLFGGGVRRSSLRGLGYSAVGTGASLVKFAPQYVETPIATGTADAAVIKLDDLLPVANWSSASFLIHFRPVEFSAATVRIFCITHSGLDDIRVYSISSNSSVRVDWDDGSPTTQNVLTDDDLIPESKLLIRHTGSSQAIFLNGRKVDEVSNTYNFANCNGDTSFGSNLDVTSSYSHGIRFLSFFAFNEPLSDAEAVALTADPYQFLRPA